MGSLIPKLGELLKEEYKLQTGVKEQVRAISLELKGAQAALRKVSEVPWDWLDEEVKLWSREVREASYDMEDIIDAFLVRVQGRDCCEHESSLKRLCQRMTRLFTKTKARHEISVAIEDIKRHLQEVTERRGRFKVDDVVARPVTSSTIDPRLAAMYTEVSRLVGIDKSSGELISMLQRGEDVSNNTKMKIVSVFGSGGLGKTTLAKTVYDKLKGAYDCWAFVPVGRNPDLKKIFKDILIELDKKRYLPFSTAVLDERQLIDELRDFFLEKKRYFLVIDDIWETKSWETIKLAMVENDCGGRIVITTRKLEVATKAGEVYELQPLPHDTSRKLFCTRIFGGEGKCLDNEPHEISDKILRKCGGVPLAIITMASLLVGKPIEKWPDLYRSIGFGFKEEAENTVRGILSFSYYDLPSYLRTCLLYLGAFPEDCVISKDGLIWKWIAEGFVHEKQGIRLFETGEGYFNDLINRSMIQAEEHTHDGSVYGCRVHDMVLDFIRLVSKEENFFTISDDGLGIPQQSIRRLAQQNRTMENTRTANRFDMAKVRSFIAYECVIEPWARLSSLRILRVLAIEGCKPRNGSRLRIEHLGLLVHLRYLSLRGTKIDKIPEEIGGLRMLQTLVLVHSDIVELPSSIRLLTQLVCLNVTLGRARPSVEMGTSKEVASVRELTSLEELYIGFRDVRWSTRRLLKELSSLRELRVLGVTVYYDEESERDFLESLPHLPKLQNLTLSHCFDGSEIPTAKWESAFALPPNLRHMAADGVATSLEELVAIMSYETDMVESLRDHFSNNNLTFCCYLDDKFPTATAMWEVAGFFLPRHLQELYIVSVKFSKLPSWISASRLPNLSNLCLYLGAVDEQGLKILGNLPELRFLHLISRSSATIRNAAIGDSDVRYFQKLRYYRMDISSVWFLPDRDGKSVSSFHIWNGKEDISMTFGPGNKGMAVAPPFMPCLQMISFNVYVRALRDHCYCDNFGLEYLPSLREIHVGVICTAASNVEVVRVRASCMFATCLVEILA
ncbi:unnamed protein product [Urochloa decumbens]|uniref:Uncharacterized protein n=1 Tax=Urochloa decumbens TaxID=240449 RepID=A0ABC9AN46_9POAL